MVASSVALAWRSAAPRARALPSFRCAQRPSIFRSNVVVPRQGAVRYASDTTTTEAAAETVKEAPKKAGRGARRIVLGTSLALTLLVGYVYGTDTRASVHRYGVVPLIRLLYPDAEDAHHLGVDTLKTLYKFGLHPRERGNPDGDGALMTDVSSIFLLILLRSGVG